MSTHAAPMPKPDMISDQDVRHVPLGDRPGQTTVSVLDRGTWRQYHAQPPADTCSLVLAEGKDGRSLDDWRLETHFPTKEFKGETQIMLLPHRQRGAVHHLRDVQIAIRVAIRAFLKGLEPKEAGSLAYHAAVPEPLPLEWATCPQLLPAGGSPSPRIEGTPVHAFLRNFVEVHLHDEEELSWEFVDMFAEGLRAEALQSGVLIVDDAGACLQDNLEHERRMRGVESQAERPNLTLV